MESDASARQLVSDGLVGGEKTHTSGVQKHLRSKHSELFIPFGSHDVLILKKKCV